MTTYDVPGARDVALVVAPHNLIGEPTGPWVDWARYIWLRHYVGPVRSMELLVGSDTVRLRFTLLVPCRTTGRPLVLYNLQSHALASDAGAFDRGTANRWFRAMLLRATEHELDECIYAGGARVFEPHAGDDPTRPPP